MFAAFFSGIFISSQYYQEKCNNYIIEHYIDPASEFRETNPTFETNTMPSFDITIENDTKLSPTKQIWSKFTE